VLCHLHCIVRSPLTVLLHRGQNTVVLFVCNSIYSCLAGPCFLSHFSARGLVAGLLRHWFGNT
jgi:hypothetical protein